MFKIIDKDFKGMTLFQCFNDAVEALETIFHYIRVGNDLEAYLNDIALWGMGKIPKPNPKDYGIEEKKENTNDTRINAR